MKMIEDSEMGEAKKTYIRLTGEVEQERGQVFAAKGTVVEQRVRRRKSWPLPSGWSWKKRNDHWRRYVSRLNLIVLLARLRWDQMGLSIKRPRSVFRTGPGT